MSLLPIKVLVVEDNPGDARLLREALAEMARTRFDWTHVDRLAEALRRLEEERFDIILLDLSLPDAQGLDAVVWAHGQVPHLPIVVLTGLENEELAVEALRQGAQDYLVKGKVDGNLLSRSIRYAIERKRAEEQIQESLRRLRALREIERATTSTLDLHRVLDVLLQKIDLLLPYAATTVRLFNTATGLLEPIACRNLSENEWKSEPGRRGRGIPNVVFENKAPWTVRDLQVEPRVRDPEFFRRHGLVSYLGLPLIAKDEVLGVLSFYTKQEHSFGDEEVEFLSTLADQAAIAIQNSQLYEEIRASRDALERANQVKEEFLSVMSHELRTPLNAILGYTEMVKEGLQGEINPEQERSLEKVVRRTRELLTMINGILQVTSMKAPAIKAERREFDLASFLDEVRSGYEFPSDKEIRFHWDYGDLPVIESDPEKLKHILQNLINNAVKFTDKGEVTVSVRVQEGDRREATGKNKDGEGPLWPHAFVEFTVTDTGIGISEEMLPVIFEKFRQVDGSETRTYGGVGLGLYIVKQFTEQLGGKIEVESAPGSGSRFIVTIPSISRRSVSSKKNSISGNPLIG
ncbi:MAG TPA: ATP-binding protein [Candidatus Binatia bacterium]|jgi:signal transduction histidine kinase/DNA-binding response OmpR family regulator